MIELIIRILIIIVLIRFVGFFTSSETAYISLTKLKMRRMIDENYKHAKTVEKLKDNMDRLLTTVLIGTNFLNSLVSALATSLIADYLGGGGVGLPTFAIAFFITTFGQIIPKTIASHNPEKVTSKSSVILLTLGKIFFPVIWIFERLSHLVIKIVEKFVNTDSNAINEDDLKTLIAVGEHEGTIEKDESRMLNKLIQFNDLSVSDIMKHRSFVSMVEASATEEETIAEFLESGFSTITVYKGSSENVVGILNYKKVMTASDDVDSGEGFAGRMKSEVQFVPATMTVLELLQKFRSEENKFAVVLNEQGATAGIVTMEDILRTVFGRMIDENSDNVAPEEKIRMISYNTFLVPGDMKLEDVNEILGLNLESEDMNTLGGWMLEQFGSLPSSGNTLIHNKVIFTAEDVFQRRIVSVKIKK